MGPYKMSEKLNLKDRFEGAIVGLAIGDALGFPLEFMYSRQEIIDSLGGRFQCTFVKQGNYSLGTFSDDTQMSLAITKALIEAGNTSVDYLMDKISHYFVEWLKSPENDRAPGSTCTAACSKLFDGIHWTKSGNNISKGCGTAMRSAPIGLYFNRLEDRERLIDIAKKSSLITHGHPSATAGSVSNALIISLALNRIPIDKWLEIIIEHSETISTKFALKIRDINKALKMNPFEGIDFLGEGWIAEEAIAIALYSFLRYPNNFRKMMELAVVHKGDSDSTGSIAGGFFGAWHGINALPLELVSTVEKKDILIKLADNLWEASKIYHHGFDNRKFNCIHLL
ncbi:MAG: ADP-ribosylglycohydrolase family protein [Candidatus Heimdallarchaeaceae archaeon]